MKVIDLGAVGVSVDSDPGPGGRVERFRLTVGGVSANRIPVLLVLGNRVAATVADQLAPARFTRESLQQRLAEQVPDAADKIAAALGVEPSFLLSHLEDNVVSYDEVLFALLRYRPTVAGHFRRNAAGDWEQVHLVLDAPADVVTLYHGEFQEQAVEDLGALREQAAAWNKVCDLLREVAPDWQDGTGTGQDNAVAAVRRMAKNEALRGRLEIAQKQLAGIHALLYPAPLRTEDGREWSFRPTGIDPHELLQELSDRIRALSAEPERLAPSDPEARRQAILTLGASATPARVDYLRDPPAPVVQRPPTGLPLDPNKIQLCRVGTHSAAMEREGQPCDCPQGTCRLWKGGLSHPDFQPPVASGVEVTPSDFGAWLDAGGERRRTPR